MIQELRSLNQAFNRGNELLQAVSNGKQMAVITPTCSLQPTACLNETS